MIYYGIGLWRRLFPIYRRCVNTVYWHVVRVRYEGGYRTKEQRAFAANTPPLQEKRSA